VDRALARGDLDSAEGRARVATEAMALVAEHPDSLVRDQYAMSIADRCQVGIDELRRRGAAAVAAGPRGRAVPSPAGTAEGALPGTGQVTPETQALRLLVHRPDPISVHLSPVLFDNRLNRAAYLALREAGDLHGARTQAGSDVADLLGRLAVQDATDDEPLGVLTRLAYLAAERAAVRLEAVARSSGDLAGYQPAITFLRTEVIKLREPVAKGADIEELLRWLNDHIEGVEGRVDG
jgi:DNA primase